MLTTPEFSKKQLELITNKAIIEEKIKIAAFIKKLFASLSAVAQEKLKNQENVNSPKISTGENLNGFPFTVLDYPRIFKSDTIFAFRTLFWWGHYLSFTVHLKGSYLTHHFQKLMELSENFPEQLYVSVDGDEWNHDINGENYKPLDQFDCKAIEVNQLLFLKVTLVIDLKELNHLVDHYHQFLKHIIVPLCDD